MNAGEALAQHHLVTKQNVFPIAILLSADYYVTIDDENCSRRLSR